MRNTYKVVEIKSWRAAQCAHRVPQLENEYFGREKSKPGKVERLGLKRDVDGPKELLWTDKGLGE